MGHLMKTMPISFHPSHFHALLLISPIHFMRYILILFSRNVIILWHFIWPWIAYCFLCMYSYNKRISVFQSKLKPTYSSSLYIYVLTSPCSLTMKSTPRFRSLMTSHRRPCKRYGQATLFFAVITGYYFTVKQVSWTVSKYSIKSTC
jgi:hypothetical protein